MSGPAAEPAPVAAGTVEPERATELETPYAAEVREFFRQLVICEKNLGLYPLHSKVVRESLDKLLAATEKCLELTGGLRLDVSQDAIQYQDEVVYEEEDRGRSLAFRTYKDGVRDISIRPGVTADELEAFATCLQAARKVDEDDDDFVTLFWERDCSAIQVQLADDYLSTEDLPDVPASCAAAEVLQLDRFKIPAEEKQQLLETLEGRRDDESGDASFEITEEEAASIREMVGCEEAYFPLFDFVDILIEVMVRNPDPEAFSRSVKMIRTIVASLIEDRDFERAAHLMEKLSSETHPGLEDRHRLQIRQMLESFTDKQTILGLDTFLEESTALPKDHPVFRLMKAFPRTAVENLCALLRHQRYISPLSGVLIHLGSEHGDVFAKHLDNPDPLVVRAMIGVLLASDKDRPLERIARALKHPDEGVRLHGAKVILENGDASVGHLFVPLLDESSKQLLNVALQFFGKVSCPFAYEKLEGLVRGRAFHVLDQKRQRLCMTALLRASFARGLEFLLGSVLRWTLSFGARSRDRKAAALLALALTDAREAKEALERFASRRRNPLSEVARRGLRQMDIRKQKVRPRAATRREKPEVERV